MLVLLLALIPLQDIDAQIQKLASDNGAKRATAIVALMEIGEKARPQLEKAARVDASRWGAEAVLEELRARRDGGKAWNPKRISIHASNRSLLRILEEMSEPFSFDGGFPDAFNIKISVDLEGVTPHTALEAITRSAGAWPYSLLLGGFEPGSRRLIFDYAPSKPLSLFDTPNYSFHVRRVEARTTIDFKQPPEKWLKLRGGMHFDPNLPLAGWGIVVITEVRDAKGRPVKPYPVAEDRLKRRFPPQPGILTCLDLTIAYPPTRVDSLALVRGFVPVITYARRHTIEFTDLQASPKQTHKASGALVKVDVRKEKSRLKLKLSIASADPDWNGLALHSLEKVKVFSQNGDALSLASYGASDPSRFVPVREVAYEMEFRLEDGATAEKIELPLQTDFFERKVHFELTDISLK